MKKQYERELACPKCGEKVLVMSGPPATPCPHCGNKIPAAAAERIYGEAGNRR